MDAKLLQAVKSTNPVEKLQNLLKDDPSIVKQLKGKETITDKLMSAMVVHGGPDSFRVMLNLIPKFAWKLNSQEQSSLHVASEGGHVEVVKEILRKDAPCSIHDRYGMILSM